eukprot:gene22649-biopygen1192
MGACILGQAYIHAGGACIRGVQKFRQGATIRGGYHPCHVCTVLPPQGLHPRAQAKGIKARHRPRAQYERSTLADHPVDDVREGRRLAHAGACTCVIRQMIRL